MTLFQQILSPLKQCPDASAYLVALSGGLDSCVLLDLMHKVCRQTKIPLRAIHIHHGLQSEADQWVEHCKKLCCDLVIPLNSVHLQIKPGKGDSLEAVAREMRYQVFEAALAQDEVVLLAQHQDDQAETLLLQLLRGAGPEGLAAMPVCRQFGAGSMLRPLLDINREQLKEYARLHKLAWIEDPSNSDMRFDRNYLRHQVMPLLKQRWPSVSKTFSRSAALCATSNVLVRNQAQFLLKQVLFKQANGEYGVNNTDQLIDCSLLGQLARSQQAIVIREWLRQKQLGMPSEVQMQQILTQMLESGDQASPLVSWSDVEVRRYRNLLYAFKGPSLFDSSQEYQWDLKQPLVLADNRYCLSAEIHTGRGIKKNKIEGLSLMVSFRNGTTPKNISDSAPVFQSDSKLSKTRPVSMKNSKLKKLMQEAGVPPWQRSSVPLLSSQGELISIVGWWIAPDFRVKSNDPGYILNWQCC